MTRMILSPCFNHISSFCLFQKAESRLRMGLVRKVGADVDVPGGLRGVQVLIRAESGRALRHQVQDLGPERC